jgi:hypothetical protein
MKIGQMVRRRDQYGVLVGLASRAWPGCLHVEWSDGRREWVLREELHVQIRPGQSPVGL